MKYLKIIFFFFLFSSFSHSQSSYTGQSIEEIFALSEEEINIGSASLVLAKEFYPNLNVDFFLYSFDYMAQRVNEVFGHYENPDERVRSLNTYFYKSGHWNDGITFGYDDDDLRVTKLSNRFINGYIASKKGSCITMPMLYIILGERLGWPIYPVRSAKHFFARYISESLILNFEQNIEATNGGSFISNKQYKLDVQIPEKAIENGVYLRTLSKKEYLASLLLVNANQHLENKNIETAKKYLKIAIKYDSTFSSAYWNYGMIHFEEARILEDELYDEKQAEISFYEILAMKNKKQETNPILDKPKQKSITDVLKVDALQKEKFQEFGSKKYKNDITKYTTPKKKILLNSNQYAELQYSLNSIEERYKPKILAKLAVYRE